MGDRLTEVASLNRAIDGNASGLAGGAASPQFTGLHRIEYGLWTAHGAARAASAGRAGSTPTCGRLRARAAPGVAITPLEYATRAHEILEDAARDLLSGADVPWSGEGVLATDAGLDATEEVIATLRPLLKGRENVRPGRRCRTRRAALGDGLARRRARRAPAERTGS